MLATASGAQDPPRRADFCRTRQLPDPLVGGRNILSAPAGTDPPTKVAGSVPAGADKIFRPPTRGSGNWRVLQKSALRGGSYGFGRKNKNSKTINEIMYIQAPMFRDNRCHNN